MQSKTRQLIQQIKTKAKNNVTNQREFINDDSVVDHAITQLFKDLKQRGLLWAHHNHTYRMSSAYQDPKEPLGCVEL